MPQTPLFQTTGSTYKHVANAGTNIVKANGGYLDRIYVGSATSGATITFYDNPTGGSGTVISVCAFTANLAAPMSQTVQLNFVTGLTVVTTGTIDLTVLYR
jgi:hypothetical protein